MEGVGESNGKLVAEFFYRLLSENNIRQSYKKPLF